MKTNCFNKIVNSQNKQARCDEKIISKTLQTI